MFRNILVANDGSPGAQAALSGAIDLALQCGSELHMICIEEIPRFAATIDEIEEEKEEAGPRFTGVIKRAKELAGQKGVSLETHLLTGHPVPSIVEFLRAGIRSFGRRLHGAFGYLQPAHWQHHRPSRRSRPLRRSRDQVMCWCRVLSVPND